MARLGKEFEERVESIEKSLLEKGFEIKSPDYIPDRLTGDQREVDVSIKGKIGSAHILIVIECRDRVTTEDVRWIEQIAQKRDDILASKMIAVSSTGFTSGAIKKAQMLGIELRNVHEINLEQIELWLNLEGVKVFGENIHFRYIGFCLEGTPNEEITPTDEYELNANDPNSKLYHVISSGELVSLYDIWLKIPRYVRSELYNGLIPEEKSKKVKMTLDLSKSKDGYLVDTKQGMRKVKRVDIEADIWLKENKIVDIKTYTYNHEDIPIAEVAEFNVDLDGNKAVVSIIREAQEGNVKVYMKDSDTKKPIDFDIKAELDEMK